MGSEKRKKEKNKMFSCYSGSEKIKNMPYAGHFQVKSENETQLKKVNSLICFPNMLNNMIFFFVHFSLRENNGTLKFISHKSGRETGKNI